MKNISFENATINVVYGGKHKLTRSIEPIQGATEARMTIGNAETGFLEIKSHPPTGIDQLTIITKDGRRIDLFNTNPIKGVSQSREFHKAFNKNSSLNSDNNSEAVYFNAIDPKTKEKVRLCVNPQGFYHVNKDGGINRNRKIRYQEMDEFYEATKEFAIKKNCNIYSPQIITDIQKNNTLQQTEQKQQVNFTNMLTEGNPIERLPNNKNNQQGQQYQIPQPQQKKPTTICTVL